MARNLTFGGDPFSPDWDKYVRETARDKRHQDQCYKLGLPYYYTGNLETDRYIQHLVDRLYQLTGQVNQRPVQNNVLPANPQRVIPDPLSPTVVLL